MQWFGRVYRLLERRLTERKRKIFIGTQHLELIAALDRKLVRLIRQRDRELGVLAHSFLSADSLPSSSDSFVEIIQEIRRIESERHTPIQDSSSSLTSLVIPDRDRSADSNVSDIELIDPSERDDLYRRRLRGLYMDLGEMVLDHEVRLSFAEQVACIEQIRSQMIFARQEREALIALLPSSKRVLTWIKVVAVSLFGIAILFLVF